MCGDCEIVEVKTTVKTHHITTKHTIDDSWRVPGHVKVVVVYSKGEVEAFVRNCIQEMMNKVQ